MAARKARSGWEILSDSFENMVFEWLKEGVDNKSSPIYVVGMLCRGLLVFVVSFVTCVPSWEHSGDMGV